MYYVEHLPRERVVDRLYELKIADRIAAQRRCKIGGEVFKLLQMVSQVQVWNVVDNIEQSHARTSIVNRLQVISQQSPSKVFCPRCTWFANQMPSGQLGSCLSASSSRHLNKKIRP